MLFPVLLFALAAAPPIQVGDMFPAFTGATISGRTVALPEAGKPLVVIFSFSRAAGDDARRWRERLGDTECYGIIMLESVPRLLRGMIASGIRSGMPPAVRDSTVISLKDEAVWRQRLAVSRDNHAYIVLVDGDGRAAWTNTGLFTDSEFSRLRAELSRLATPR